MFVKGEKQTSNPKEAIKRIVGREAARDYYAGRSTQKGGMRHEAFGMEAWGDVGAALKERSKMFKMWYAKQGSRFCGVGYWTIKWERT